MSGIGYIVPSVETHLLRSRHVAQTFRIDVMQPLRRERESEYFPVVFATDADLTFDVLKGISHAMQLAQDVAPRFLLVGIGYPGDSPWRGSRLRARDFTFAGFPDYTGTLPNWPQIVHAEPGTKIFGGAEEFQRFLSEELLPFIDERYPTIPAQRAYFGHSAGGTFGLFTMFTERKLFKHYFIVSPALIYGADDFGLRRARDFIATAPVLEDIGLYLAVGAEEEDDPERALWRFVTGHGRLAQLLREADIPGLRFRSEVLSAETHMTAWPIAFMHGVRALLR